MAFAENGIVDLLAYGIEYGCVCVSVFCDPMCLYDRATGIKCVVYLIDIIVFHHIVRI